MRRPEDVLGQFLLDSGDNPNGVKVGYPIEDVWYWAGYDDDVEWFPYGPGWLPAAWKVVAEGGNIPYRVTMAFELSEGEPVCANVTLYRRSTLRAPGLPTSRWRQENDLTVEGLRQIPLARLVRNGTLAALASVPRTDDRPAQHPELEEWSQIYASDKCAKRSRGKRLDDSHYREVARVYREARQHKHPPLQAIRAHFSCSTSSAARWVGEARNRGFLGKTRKGRAGEEPAFPRGGA